VKKKEEKREGEGDASRGRSLKRRYCRKGRMVKSGGNGAQEEKVKFRKTLEREGETVNWGV